MNQEQTIISNILALLSRTQLEGKDVRAFNECVAYLEKLYQEKADKKEDKVDE